MAEKWDLAYEIETIGLEEKWSRMQCEIGWKWIGWKRGLILGRFLKKSDVESTMKRWEKLELRNSQRKFEN